MPQTTHAKPVAPRLRSAAPPVTTVHATATSPAVGALTRGRVINTLSPRQCSFSSSFSSFSGAASRQPNFCSVFRHDSNISSVSSRDPDTGDNPAQGSTSRVESLAGAVSPDWLSSSMSHAEIVSTAAAHVPSRLRSRRVERALHTISHSPATPQGGFIPWPRRSSDPPSPPPPSITPELVRAVEQQDQHSDPDAPYPPALAGFVSDLERWHRRLLQHFGMSQSSYASNTRAAASRIRSRISFLPRERVTRVMRVVTEGYTIPFVSVPPPFHRQHNSPDLRQHRDQAWAALHKDMSHGAVVPCDIPGQGLPDVVSPVRTAPKGWRTGKRRFVINMRYLNSFIPEGESSCDMENLQSIRNMLTFQGTPRRGSFRWTSRVGTTTSSFTSRSGSSWVSPCTTLSFHQTQWRPSTGIFPDRSTRLQETSTSSCEPCRSASPPLVQFSLMWSQPSRQRGGGTRSVAPHYGCPLTLMTTSGSSGAHSHHHCTSQSDCLLPIPRAPPQVCKEWVDREHRTRL